ncbi:retrovirus-related pol polyprotein from transposon TNT 1-94 [Tanacetum coccineum]
MFGTIPPIPPPFGASSGNLGSPNVNRVDMMPATTDPINTMNTTNASQSVIDENLPQLLDSRGGSHVTNVPTFEKEDFMSWKVRFLVFLDSLEPYILKTLADGPFVPMSCLSTSENPLSKRQNQWAFMKIAEDEPSVGKADARSGQWVDITMKKVHKLLSMTDGDERKHVLDYTHIDFHYVEDQRKNLEPLPPLPNLIGATPFGTSESLISLSDLTLNMADLTLDTPDPKKTRPSVKVSPTYVIKKKTEKSLVGPKPCSNKKDDSSTEQLLLTLIEEVKGLKRKIKIPSGTSSSSTQPSSSKASKQKTWFGPCKHCGFRNHLSDDCYSKTKCSTCGSTDHLTKEHLEHAIVKNTLSKLKAPSPLKPSPKKTPMIPKPFIECKYCGFNDHHSDHYEFYPRCEDYLKRSVWYLDSGCSRHMTGIKQYLHRYSKESGPKVVFGDDSSRDTKGKMENLNEVRVKELRSNNGTKFRNYKLEEFCDKKGCSTSEDKKWKKQYMLYSVKIMKPSLNPTQNVMQSTSMKIDPFQIMNSLNQGVKLLSALAILNPPEFTEADNHLALNEPDQTESADLFKPSEPQNNVIIKLISDVQPSPTISPLAESSFKPQFLKIDGQEITYMGFMVYQMDVKSAFLNGEISEEVYVQQPPGFESSEYPNHICKLDKALYRLKQAPRAWYETLSKFLIQHKFVREEYVKDLLKKYDLADCALVKCPMLPPNNLGPDESGVSVNETLYQANLKESHLVAVKRIFKYLKGTLNLGLWYLKGSGFDLKAYSDSDYAGCNLDRKSTSGGCQILGGKLIKSQLADYDVLYDKVPIFCDNTSAIAISNNPVLHSRRKYIDIRYHFITDHILKGDIELHFVPTDLQLADIFTKPLAEPSFTRLVAELGMLNIEKQVSDKKKDLSDL